VVFSGAKRHALRCLSRFVSGLLRNQLLVASHFVQVKDLLNMELHEDPSVIAKKLSKERPMISSCSRRTLVVAAFWVLVVACSSKTPSGGGSGAGQGTGGASGGTVATSTGGVAGFGGMTSSAGGNGSGGSAAGGTSGSGSGGSGAGGSASGSGGAATGSGTTVTFSSGKAAGASSALL